MLQLLWRSDFEALQDRPCRTHSHVATVLGSAARNGTQKGRLPSIKPSSRRGQKQLKFAMSLGCSVKVSQDQ